MVTSRPQPERDAEAGEALHDDLPRHRADPSFIGPARGEAGRSRTRHAVRSMAARGDAPSRRAGPCELRHACFGAMAKATLPVPTATRPTRFRLAPPVLERLRMRRRSVRRL